MAGTACGLCVSNDDMNAKTNGFELFSSWLFGKANAHCQLLAINQNGCDLLIPESHILPVEVFKLIIMSPDDSKRVHSILTARPYWVDSDFSLAHKKLNCSFSNLDDGMYGEINLLADYLKTNYEKYIKCNILKS